MTVATQDPEHLDFLHTMLLTFARLGEELSMVVKKHPQAAEDPKFNEVRLALGEAYGMTHSRMHALAKFGEAQAALRDLEVNFPLRDHPSTE